LGKVGVWTRLQELTTISMPRPKKRGRKRTWHRYGLEEVKMWGKGRSGGSRCKETTGTEETLIRSKKQKQKDISAKDRGEKKGGS